MDNGHIGVLIISHGSSNTSWVQLVDEATQHIKLPADIPVVSCFLEMVEGRLIQDGIDQLAQMGVAKMIVVPLFVSSGSTHIDEIHYLLGVIDQPQLTFDASPCHVPMQVQMTSPIDDDPLIAEIILENIAELSTTPAQESLLLLGHGSKEKGFYRKWQNGLNQLARRLQQQGGFAAVETAMLKPDQAACKLRVFQRKHPQHDFIVVPLFLSEGYFTRKVIPDRLAGFCYRYNGRALLPNARITAWIERQVVDQLQDLQEWQR